MRIRTSSAFKKYRQLLGSLILFPLALPHLPKHGFPKFRFEAVPLLFRDLEKIEGSHFDRRARVASTKRERLHVKGSRRHDHLCSTFPITGVVDNKSAAARRRFHAALWLCGRLFRMNFALLSRLHATTTASDSLDLFDCWAVAHT